MHASEFSMGRLSSMRTSWKISCIDLLRLKYSMFSAPDNIIGHLVTIER